MYALDVYVAIILKPEFLFLFTHTKIWDSVFTHAKMESILGCFLIYHSSFSDEAPFSHMFVPL